MGVLRVACYSCLGAVLIAGCNTIFGVDDLELSTPKGSGGNASQGGGITAKGGSGAIGGGENQAITLWAAPISLASTSEAAAGYSLSLTFDHQQLVTDGLAEASGNDLRVLYDDGSGNLVEVDRVVGPFSGLNEATTKIWWRAQQPVGKGNTEGIYYLAYGGVGPTPRQDPHNVYTVWEDFNDASKVSGTFSKGADLAPASATIEGGRLVLTSSDSNIGGTDDKPAFWYWSVKGSFEVDSVVAAVSNPVARGRLGGIMLRTFLSSNAPSHWFGPVGDPNTLGSVTRIAPSAEASQSLLNSGSRVPMYGRVRLLGDRVTTFRSNDGDAWTLHSVATFEPSLGAKDLLVGVAHSSEGAATSGASIDWIRIRARISSEPLGGLREAKQINWVAAE